MILEITFMELNTLIQEVYEEGYTDASAELFNAVHDGEKHIDWSGKDWARAYAKSDAKDVALSAMEWAPDLIEKFKKEVANGRQTEEGHQ